MVGTNKDPAITAADYNFNCLAIDTLARGGDTATAPIKVQNIGTDTLRIYGWQTHGVNISDAVAADYFTVLSPSMPVDSAHAYSLLPDSILTFIVRAHPSHSFPAYDSAILVYFDNANHVMKDTSFLYVCALVPSGIMQRTNTGAQLAEPSIGQNAPNPFSDATDILVSLTAGCHARLTVFNSMGTIVATPLDAYMPPGERIVHVDATNLPSGFYYYRLQTNAGTILKTMTIVK